MEQQDDLPVSFAQIIACDDSHSVSDIFDVVGRGAVSRMFFQEKTVKELVSIGRFFERGSTLGSATAFTDVSVAKSNRNSPSFDEKAMYKAETAFPVDEMQFYNIGGSHVYSYYGLDTIRTAKSIADAGLHVRDTAIGVLMLDSYHINERPGDPSNPLTFWPYQTFHAAPQGITFAECKKVGSSGANAGVDYPLQTTAICQALQSLAEVASNNGYKRLIITGDCGFYSLATAAYAKKLGCWGSQSWTPHPDGAFAGFCVPRFKCPSLDLDVILSMGTPQLISNPDPEKNLASKTNDASVIYLTADTRGFYNGDAKEEVDGCYKPFLERTWDTDINDIEMLDVVVRANEKFLDSIDIKDDPNYFVTIAKTMVEYNRGSAAALVGLFLGNLVLEESEGNESNVWNNGGTLLEPIVENMVLGEDGSPLSDMEEVLTKCEPIFDYLRPLLLVLVNAARGVESKQPLDSLTEMDEFKVYAALMGNPAPSSGEKNTPTTWHEMKSLVALRMQDALLSLIYTGKLVEEIDGLPIGAAYADTFALYNANLNQAVLSRVDRSHGIDGDTLLLFDCRYVPGFGIPVNLGSTVWTAAKNYFWMGTVLRRFAKIMQDRGSGPVMCHLECTELFSFSPFLQEMGLPVVDAINSISIASRCHSTPIRYVKCTQDRSTFVPRTPSALVGDMSDTSKYFRDLKVQVRTPTEDGIYFAEGELGVKNLLQEEKKLWKDVKVARPLFDDFELLFGVENDRAEPGDSLFAPSCALDLDREFYVDPLDNDDENEETAEYDGDSSVQYAVEEKEGEWMYSEFFGDEIVTDPPFLAM